MKKQVHVYYSGRVQGVGFRYTVEDIAQDMGIGGWVKNLHDGRVELAAEAEEETLKDFLKKIEESFSGCLRDRDIEWFPATGEFKDFAIKF